MEGKTLDAARFRRELVRVHDWSPQHVIGQTRANAQAALDAGTLQDGWTVTFHDEEGDDAYCLAVVEGGELVVRFKTHDSLREKLDS